VAEPEAPAGRLRAAARSRVSMRPETVQMVNANELKKGDVLGVARFAGIQAALGAPAVFPVTRASAIESVSVEFEVADAAIDVVAYVEGAIDAQVSTHALAAAATAALTIYDMCKSVDHTMVIADLSLVT
jgi:cyclic pyranopterin monophosphate synthase